MSTRAPRPYPAAPVVPELSKELEEACPPLKPLPDGSVKSLVEAAATDPIFYAECKRNFQDAILKYKRVKKEQDSHRAQVELYYKK
jgi:hypothetical protein